MKQVLDGVAASSKINPGESEKTRAKASAEASNKVNEFLGHVVIIVEFFESSFLSVLTSRLIEQITNHIKSIDEYFHARISGMTEQPEQEEASREKIIQQRLTRLAVLKDKMKIHINLDVEKVPE